MLIRFKVTNYLSFREETEFSMVAGRERIHPNHVIRGKDDHPKLLRAALVYGPNGAGKSNFVRALDFAKKQILRVSSPVQSSIFGINPFSFRLDPTLQNSPSCFVFEFVANNTLFEYGFKTFFNYIVEEWLIDLSKDKAIFKRKTSEKEVTKFEETEYVRGKTEKEFLRFVQKSIIPSQLFLTHSILHNVTWLEPIHNWFLKTLNIIFPHTADRDLEERLNKDKDFKDFFTEFMQKAGTGISDVTIRQMKRRKPTHLRIRNNFLKKDSEQIIEEDEFEHILQLFLVHEGKKSDEIPLFGKSNESDGTQRLFDLMSPLYELVSDYDSRVYVIDELERSLHANVSYMILRSYLEQCDTNNNQLIATTHQTHLLDLKLLRRDEIWFAEKDREGATQLYSLYEFNPRYDKKIEKEYLTGRFGAIPFLGNIEFKQRIAKNSKSKN